MIQATNTEHLEPLTATRSSITTGWGKGTVYVGEDYITDGASLVEASLLKPADRQKLAQRLGVGWPASRPLPSQKAVSGTVDRALAAERTPVELLGVTGEQAFLLVGKPTPPLNTVAVTRWQEYFLPVRLPDDVLVTPEDQQSRCCPAGTAVRVVAQNSDSYLVTPVAEAGAWWHWLLPRDLQDDQGQLLPAPDPNQALRTSAIVPAARLAYLVKLTGADRITATPHRKSGPHTYVLWVGECFAGLLAVA